MRTAIVNGTLLDTDTMTMVGERHLVLEGDVVVDVGDTAPIGAVDRTIDARGRFVLPGFIDAHVHHVITTMDFPRLQRMSPVELSLGMGKLAEATLRRGFTTVRDTGGDTAGLVRAIATGLCDGPRIVRSGRVISQTGGHGDLDSTDRSEALCACRIHTNSLGHVADGADAVRLAVRSELKAGSDFIKIMSSGGVASPTDPFDAIQYTADEVRAATIETDHRHTYATSHAYQPDAISLAIENGVRCIEHGNLVDTATAVRMSELGVTMVPTLVTYWAMQEMGAKLGMPERNLEKNQGVFEHGQRSIDIAKSAGVALGFGTDLLGEAQPWQPREFAIRADLEPAADVLRSMYHVNARLCALEGVVGVLAPGSAADVVVSDVDPLANLSGLAEPDTVVAVIARGRTVVDRT
ncbi:amidohydrolase family protein [Ilumatobacter sp.]|uniref:metal-dependent hydrolase family protein n=1 Tax=Ilumatobacter sp. TaxID=1967498 RepID=UPI003AF89568